MRRSHGFLVMTIVLGAGGLGVYRAVHDGVDLPEPGPASPRPRAGAATTADSAELAELRRELVQLRHQVWTQGQRMPTTDPASAGTPDRATTRGARTDPEARAEHERRYREYMAGIAAAFHQEIPDPRWSAATTEVVQAALAADSDVRPLARGVECRAHTCRVELADDGSGSLGKLVPMFAQQVSESLPSATAERIEDASGAATMVLYLTRRDEPPVTGR